MLQFLAYLQLATADYVTWLVSPMACIYYYYYYYYY